MQMLLHSLCTCLIAGVCCCVAVCLRLSEPDSTFFLLAVNCIHVQYTRPSQHKAPKQNSMHLIRAHQPLGSLARAKTITVAVCSLVPRQQAREATAATVGPMKRCAAELEQLGALKCSKSRCNKHDTFRAADRENSGSCAIFANGDLQKLVFEYVGGQQWLSMGAVCKQWQELYRRACWERVYLFRRVADRSKCRFQDFLDYVHCSTAYSALFSSAPLLQMGVDSGSLDLLQHRTQFNAGRHGTEATLELAHMLDMPCSEHVLNGAARSGCASKLQWLLAQHAVRLPATIAEYAATSGSVAMLQLLQQEGVAFTARTSGKAAEGGHVHVLQFLHSSACPIDWRACNTAAERGDLPMLRYLQSIGCEVAHEFVVDSAAESGSVEVMAWLIDECGAELMPSIMQTAAISHHLPLCQYLYDQGCPWSAETTEFLLKCKLLRELEWALSQGVVFTAKQLRRYERRKAKQLKAKADAEALSACGKRKR
jgi:hypothetical protein